MKIFKILFWTTISIIVIASCGPNYIFQAEKNIPNATWTYADSLQFDFMIQDTQKVYNLVLSLDHSANFSYQNLYVKLKTTFPDGQKNSQAVSLELANKYGAWLGDCNETDCQIHIPIQEHVFFPKEGNYRIVLEQFMRKDSIAGLQKFALKIEQTELKKQ